MILPINDIRIGELWYKLNPKYGPKFDDIYMISTFGRIYNKKTETYIPKNIYYNKNKYITVHLRLSDNKTAYFQIHRLMMMIFNPIPNYKDFNVNHKDGIKYHNWVWNLEWVTESENVLHAIANNLIPLGEDRGNSKLKNNDVHKICLLISQGLSNREIINSLNDEISGEYGLEYIIKNIRSKLSWRHISDNYDFSKMYRRKNKIKGIN